LANRTVLKRARNVIVPDRFMAERVNRKRNVADKLSAIPLWSHDRLIEPTNRIENPFRAAHNLGSRFVVMHAGNHGPSNPIETLVDAAVLLRDDPRFVFVFVGGGIRKSRVEAVAGASILSLPYEPLERIKYSLSAADVQVVTQGDNMVGIVHPSKFYAAMAVARPVVFIGPAVSHAGEVIAQHEIGWRIEHGDAAGFAALLRRCVGDGASLMPATGARARAVVQEYFSERAKCGELCDLISATLNCEPTRRGATSG
ncbi:MAG TPA: glycosyltransferase, partial [Gemmatimonadaceae bacterium]|nr:glycosyltransferase [Gemmatimonadaceae bacterium]